MRAAFCLIVALLSGCSSVGDRSKDPRLTLIETDPKGASVFIDGGFVGTTPASFYGPAKPQVDLRLELPGYVPQEDLLVRSKKTPPDSAEGIGWEESYYYPLTPKK
jgi:hypothetical protein